MATLEPTVERRQYPARRTSWGAIFGGVFIAVAIMVVLGTLGVAIGAQTIDPATGDTPGARAFGIGAGIWWLVTGIIAFFAGGWAAGRLAGLRRRMEGTLHGVVTWAFTTAALVVLMSTVIGALVSGAFRVVSQGAQLAGQGIQAAGQQIGELGIGDRVDLTWDEVWQEAETVLRQTKTEELQPDQLREQAAETRDEAAEAARQAELGQALSRMADSARDTVDAADREAVVNVLVARTDMSRAEAEKTVDRWSTQLESAWQDVEGAAGQARDTAAQAAEATASAVSSAAWWTFFYFIITALAAAGGGLLGAPKRREPVAVAAADPNRADPVV